MSDFLKPQSPLQHKDGAYVYPLTTADQVILEDNSRLNTAFENLVYVSEEKQETAIVPVDADTLGGHPVEDFIKPKAGFIYPLAGSTIPEGFLLCDGAAYSRTEYKELFAAVGTVYGSGDGSTTFNVPNLQTRVPVGAGGEFSLGATGGETEHTLTVDEMPSHNHSSEDNNTTGNIGFQESSDHGYAGFAMPWTYISERTDLSIHVASNGGSQPHNNMQPYTVVNYIIATGKDTGVSVSDIIMGAQAIPLSLEYGGTGATTLKDARHNLGVNARNLLDNSDFRNPVNQRMVENGTRISSYSYFIDRWKTIDLPYTYMCNANGLYASEKMNLMQYIPDSEKLVGKTLTFAAKCSGKVLIATRKIVGSTSWDWTPNDGFSIEANSAAIVEQGNGNVYVQIGLYAEGDYIEWAALYEGEYNAETLPEYQPKGYGAELAECQRYFLQYNFSDVMLPARMYSSGGSADVSFFLPCTMRLAKPTVSVTASLCQLFADNSDTDCNITEAYLSTGNFVGLTAVAESNLTGSAVAVCRIIGKLTLSADL